MVHLATRAALTCGFVLLGTAAGARPKADAELIQALQSQVAALEARVEALESSARANRAPAGEGGVLTLASYESGAALPAARTGSGDDWPERIKIKGDFRYRHETIDAENARDRHRQRIRARAALVAQVSEDVEVGLGLASGGDDPVSANQTLGGGFSSKSINIDLAYMSWRTPISGLEMRAGKFKNPLHRAGNQGLVWDSDLTPEGAAFTYANDLLFASGIGLWLEESSSGSDSLVVGGQLGIKHAFNDDTAVIAGVGYYDLGLRGEPVAFDGDPRGNQVDAAGNYLYGFEELELFAEASFRLGEPRVTVFADYITNLDADDYDSGYSVGTRINFTGGDKPWQLAYTYKDLEANATNGLLTDSDFIGGGTDGSGHIIHGSYGLTDRISLAGTLFLNERGGNLGTEEDFTRLMLDVNFKY